MQIIYRANDGTDFHSEEECESYENKQKIAAMNLQSRFFDYGGDIMDITDLYNCIENGWYMEIATNQEAIFIAKYAEETVGVTLFEGKPTTGRFYWNDINEEWRDIEDIFNNYQKKLRIFED